MLVNTGVKSLIVFCFNHGMELDYSPSYASQSNGATKRLLQDYWKRTRVLLFASKLPTAFWTEAMIHANWLRNRSPSSQIPGRIPILEWEILTKIDFWNITAYDQPGYAFVYRWETMANKKLFPRSAFAHFVGIQNYISLLCACVLDSNSVIRVRSWILNPLTSLHSPTHQASWIESYARKRLKTLNPPTNHSTNLILRNTW